ncbi:MAG: 30S ribosomal protein S9 [Rickettsiaceae bacterium]
MEVPTLEEITVKSQEAKKVEIKNVIVQCKSRKSIAGGGGYGTGHRKNSVARVWVKPGKGQVTVNNKDVTAYFPRETYRKEITQPFIATNTDGMFDVFCTTKGGGTTGQAGAIVNGIARALDCISEDYHVALRQGGFLTRDSRVVERKKYGRRKARKLAQFSKR